MKFTIDSKVINEGDIINKNEKIYKIDTMAGMIMEFETYKLNEKDRIITVVYNRVGNKFNREKERISFLEIDYARAKSIVDNYDEIKGELKKLSK